MGFFPGVRSNHLSPAHSLGTEEIIYFRALKSRASGSYRAEMVLDANKTNRQQHQLPNNLSAILLARPQCTLADSSKIPCGEALHCLLRQAAKQAGMLAESYEDACIFIMVSGEFCVLRTEGCSIGKQT